MGRASCFDWRHVHTDGDSLRLSAQNGCMGGIHMWIRLVDAPKTNAKIFTHSSYFMHMSSESKFMLITIIKTQRGKKKRTRKTS